MEKQILQNLSPMAIFTKNQQMNIVSEELKKGGFKYVSSNALEGEIARARRNCILN